MSEFDIEVAIFPLLVMLAALDALSVVFVIMYIIEPKILPDSLYQTPFPAIIGIQTLVFIINRLE